MSLFPPNLNRGRFLLFAAGVFIAFFVPAMMTVGSLSLSDTTLRWVTTAVTICSVVGSYWVVLSATCRGKPRWLFKPETKDAFSRR